MIAFVPGSVVLVALALSSSNPANGVESLAHRATMRCSPEVPECQVALVPGFRSELSELPPKVRSASMRCRLYCSNYYLVENHKFR